MEAPPAGDAPQDVAALHQALVDDLKRVGNITTPRVEAAFRAVPRHLFLPAEPLDKVYRDEAIATKHQDGVAISASSQPAIMAIMLEQLGLEPGHRVLEIGAGTGYNAALMAHIVGEAGRVVALDIDQDIVDGARAHLAAAGFDQVRVIRGDGGFGYPVDAPYDRVILTVGASDILPAWREQLQPGGRLVLPLSIRGAQQSLAFERVDGHLRSLSASGCGFMALRGAFATPQPTMQLGPEASLSLTSLADPSPVDAGTVSRWLAEPGRDRSTAVQLTQREVYEGAVVWLAAREPGYCALGAEGEMARRGVVPLLYGSPGTSHGTVGLIRETSLAVLMLSSERLPSSEPPYSLAPSSEPQEAPQVELAIRCFGPEDEAAERIVDHIMAWDAAGRPTTAGLRIRVYPQETSYTPAAHEAVVENRWSRLVFDWS